MGSTQPLLELLQGKENSIQPEIVDMETNMIARPNALTDKGPHTALYKAGPWLGQR